jgi:hypothetical protein
MKKVFEHLETLDFDEKTINSIGRVVHIWEERGIFDKRIQARGFKRKKCSYTYLRNLFVTSGFVLLPYFLNSRLKVLYFAKIQARASNKMKNV